MSTTVTYKGSTLTTVNNATKTLNTAGTWLEGDITIVDTTSSVTMQSKTKSYTPSATAQSETVTADSGYDGLSSVAISVGAIPQGESDIAVMNASFYDDNGVRKWRIRAGMDVWDGWLPAGEYYGKYMSRNAVAANTTITPSLTEQTVGGANWMMEGPVTVAAMPVSGTISIDDSGDWDVTYARTASVPAGTAGTPSASKGTVSNHTVSVTPSVTNSTGWINGGTKTGSAVTVSASELVSGTLSVTQNGTADVTNYASVNVNVSGSSSWTLVKSTTVTASTTSTSATNLTTISCGSSIYDKDVLVYIKIRDKAGKRSTYFYGSDSVFYNYFAANGATTTMTYASRTAHRVNSSGLYYTYPTATTSGYGVYPYSITSGGVIQLRTRYNESYSLTIDGTYQVDVYTLTLPNGASPFE